MKFRKILIPVFSLALLLTACGQTAVSSSPVSSDGGASTENLSASIDGGQAAALTETGIDVSDMFTSRDTEIGYDEFTATYINLLGDSAECTSNDVKISGSTVTITDEGTYIVSGTLTNGMIIVDTEDTDKPQIVLSGADITSASSAAIYVRQADKVFITLASGTENSLSNGGVFTAIDDNNIDAAIFSKDDLTLNGEGSLTIVSPAGHGVVSKDDLAVTSGSYTITAASHGLSGKDSIRIADGSFSVTSGKDALHAENADDASLGFVYICGGRFELVSDGDGVSASGAMQIDGGDFSVLAGGGSANAPAHQNSDMGWGGRGGFTPGTTAADTTAETTTEESTSMKGFKSALAFVINDGTFSIDSADDALHCGQNLVVNGGGFEIATGDDGMHADETTAITGGSIVITESYEGIEGLCIEISGGDISLVSSDDGLNAAGGNDASGMGGAFGGDSFGASSECKLTISGGVLNINAGGDGVDSNGTLLVSGGETYVSGPTDSGNGALDYGSEAVITGGVFIAAGASGMATNFTSGSTQCAMLVSFDTQAAGSTITLSSSDGTEIVSWQAEKSFSSVVISCPEIAADGTYTLTAGSSSTDITMSGVIYGAGFGMGGMGGGMHGGAGGTKGERPAGGFTLPDGTEITPPDGTFPEGTFPEGAMPQGGIASDGTMPDGTVPGVENSQPAVTPQV